MRKSDSADDRRKQAVKSRPLDVLHALGIETEGYGGYHKFRCPCPDHEDNNPSAVLYAGSEYYECFGCGWWGDALDLIALVYDLEIREDFVEILQIGSCAVCKPKDLPSKPARPGKARGRKRVSSRGPRSGRCRTKRAERKAVMEPAKQEVERIVATSSNLCLSIPEMEGALIDLSPIPVPDEDALESAAHLMVRTLFAGKRIWLGRFTSKGIPYGKVVDVTEDTLEASIDSARAGESDLRLTPSTYQCKQDHRRGENVHEQCYAVLEMDELRGRKPESADEIEELKCRCLILIKWLAEHGVVRPVAVVDTGNKSYHVWVEAPAEDRAQDVLDQVEAMGFDLRAYKNKVCPVRAPGCVHGKTGRAARLLWLAPPSGRTEATEVGSTCENL